MKLDVSTVVKLQQLLKLVEVAHLKRIIADIDLEINKNNLLTIVQTELWPSAVDVNLIINQNDESAKRMRANSILSNFVRLTAGKRFLDYGCGEGHCVLEAIRRDCSALGYDPVKQNWEQFNDKIQLTSDFNAVQAGGPYDIILLHDVLDHIMDGTQSDALTKIKTLLANDGCLYVRCHPYTSIHGTHLYYTLNKAYVHLMFTDKEIEKLGGKPLPTQRIVRPYLTYRKWFQESGWKISEDNAKRGQIPVLFGNDKIVSNLIASLYGQNDKYVTNCEVLHSILSIQFIDFKLIPATT